MRAFISTLGGGCCCCWGGDVGDDDDDEVVAVANEIAEATSMSLALS